MKRMMDCGTWRDVWFEELRPLEKLLFIYLFAHPEGSPCGAFEVSIRTIHNDTAIPDRLIPESLLT